MAVSLFLSKSKVVPARAGAMPARATGHAAGQLSRQSERWRSEVDADEIALQPKGNIIASENFSSSYLESV